MTVDMATMFGMLELSAGRACPVNQTLYVYNMANHLNDFRVDEAKQLALERHVRSLAPLRPLLWW